ncbi:Mitochondrial amidoxime reducing component 2 [Tyrophagus putrescentiae]|nr:Mitochondrial amidoxime reducing component 2 [Tyrophagus putrescentiae]
MLERAGTRKEGILKLIIYPIKSVPGIEVDHLEVTPTGVTYGGFHDRALMLINEHRNLVSLRTKPTLACIKATFEGDGDSIVLRAPSMPPLVISSRQDVSANEQFTFSFWNQETTGFEYSQEASAWFSLYLKSTTRLVKSHYQPSSSSSDTTSLRKTELHTEADELVLDADHRLVYQDECAVALANESSLAELNRRLTAKGRPPVGYRNFRPNIFLRNGQPPFGEDAWRRIGLGSGVVLKLAKPCHRCTTTTTDPDSGRKNDHFEPLETLKEFRVREEYSHLYSSSPLFGLSLSPVALGTLRLGDPLTVLEEKQKK